MWVEHTVYVGMDRLLTKILYAAAQEEPVKETTHDLLGQK